MFCPPSLRNALSCLAAAGALLLGILERDLTHLRTGLRRQYEVQAAKRHPVEVLSSQ